MAELDVDKLKIDHPYLDDAQIDALAAKANLTRSDRTFMGRLAGGAKAVTDVLFPTAKDYVGRAWSDPQSFKSTQMENVAHQQVKNGDWASAVKGLPAYLGQSFSEQIAPAGEVAPWLMPPAKAFGMASPVARIANMGLTGMSGGAVRGFTAPAATAEKRIETGVMSSLAGLGTGLAFGAGSEKISSLRNAANLRKLQEQQAANVGNIDTIASLPPDVVPDQINLDNILTPRKTYAPTQGEQMILEQFKVGSRAAQRSLRLPQTIKNINEYGLLSSDFNKMGQQAEQAGRLVDHVVNYSLPPVPVNVDEAMSAAKQASTYAVGVTDRDVNAVMQKIADTTKYGDTIGFQNADVAMDTYRKIRNFGMIQASKAVRGGEAGQFSQMSDPAAESLADIYFAFSDKLLANINRDVGGAPVAAAKTPQVMAVAEKISPLLAQKLNAATTVGEINRIGADFWRLLGGINMTNDAATSPIYNAMLKSGGMIPAIARATIQSRPVAIEGGKALINATNSLTNPALMPVYDKVQSLVKPAMRVLTPFITGSTVKQVNQ
jgi:hypothetical protein